MTSTKKGEKGDWLDKIKEKYVGKESPIPETALKHSPLRSAEKPKGDWLDGLVEKWRVDDTGKYPFAEFMADIRKGHEADLDLLTDANSALYEQVRQLKADLEAARKAEDMAEESKQKCLKIIKKLEQEIARIAFLVE